MLEPGDFGHRAAEGAAWLGFLPLAGIEREEDREGAGIAVEGVGVFPGESVLDAIGADFEDEDFILGHSVEVFSLPDFPGLRKAGGREGVDLRREGRAVC